VYLRVMCLDVIIWTSVELPLCTMLSVCCASDTSICLLCAEFHSLLLLYACCVFGVCNGPRHYFSFSDRLEAAARMHLHSSRMVVCYVGPSLSCAGVCGVVARLVCGVVAQLVCVVVIPLDIPLVTLLVCCVYFSNTTRVRCVRDEYTSRRLRSCTGHQVGSCPAHKPKEHRQVW